MKLRNLFFAILLCFLGPCTAYPAWLFDSTDNVTMADGAATSLPNADWTIACRVRLTSTTGWATDGTIFVAVRQSGGGEGEIGVGIDQDSGTVDNLQMYIADDAYGSEIDVEGTGAPFTGNTNWNLVIVKRIGANIVAKVNNSTVFSESVGGIDSLDFTTPWHFGSGLSSNYLPGALADCAKWNRATSDAEDTAMMNFSTNCFMNGLAAGSGWMVPMTGAYQELVNPLAVTNTGTTATAHPGIFMCN